MALLPLFYVFLSGLGFSIQTLFVKLLVLGGYHSSFVCVFYRGLFQMLLSIFVMFYNRDQGIAVFGETWHIKTILFFRSVIGYGGIAFAFLAVEVLPVGDATVLTMLSPFVSLISSFC